MFALGLMSGTSLDGVDGVLAEFSADAAPLVRGHAYRPFSAELADELLALQSAGQNEIVRGARAARSLVEIYATVVEQILAEAKLRAADIAAIGAHGQTIRHRPVEGFTVQLNAPAYLSELTGIDVIADFRSADVAAGGQGAPLVPAVHAALFRHPTSHRAIVNLGGIANITDLPASGSRAPVRGWDCGPANVLLDLWATRHGHGPVDVDGSWSAGGQIDAILLDELMAEPWLALSSPKSTGRDLFHGAWLDQRLDAARVKARALEARDIQTTLCEFSAGALSASLKAEAPDAVEVFVCGGGARNPDLMRRIERRSGLPVQPTDRLGLPSQHVEALAFAWLAVAYLEGRPGNLVSVTGARGARVLGALYPAPKR